MCTDNVHVSLKVRGGIGINVDNSIIGIHSMFLQMLIVFLVFCFVLVCVSEACPSFHPSVSLLTCPRVHLCNGPGLCPQPAVW